MNVNELFKLSGKVAIVTGGSRGIGKEIAIGLGEAGARVLITARRDEWLGPAYEELISLGFDCLAVKADVINPEDVKRVVSEALQRWNKIDILVNNAGVTWGAPPEDMPLEKWNSVWNTNATGTLICCQQVGREMLKQGSGNIINITSTTGLLAIDPRMMQAIGYQASKAAIAIMTKQLAVQWAKNNIRVNAVAPFFIKTRMTKDTAERGEGLMIQTIPMGRLGHESELKGVVVFLASEASSYMTGQVLKVDGGLSAW